MTPECLSEVPTESSLPASASTGPNVTLFSSARFVEAWAKGLGGLNRPISLDIRGSGPPRTMHGISRRGLLGLRNITLAPDGLYASPDWNETLDRATLADTLRQLRRPQTMSFVWNVRYDHALLAANLGSLGVAVDRNQTHVLPLQSDYDKVFAGFSSTIRNHIRRANRHGLRIRESDRPDDLRAYYDVHVRLAEQQGNYESIYPISLFFELMKLPDLVRFLVVELNDRLISGGFFFVDGCSVMYWHGATDRAFSKYYPSCALFDAAIRWACERGAMSFNFGGSAGIASLEQFKLLWGSRPEWNWRFAWTNPYWAPVALRVRRLQVLPARLARRLKRLR